MNSLGYLICEGNGERGFCAYVDPRLLPTIGVTLCYSQNQFVYGPQFNSLFCHCRRCTLVTEFCRSDEELCDVQTAIAGRKTGESIHWQVMGYVVIISYRVNYDG